MEQKELIACLQRSIDFIEDHLRLDIALSEVAKVSRYSSWHFQRLFKALTGHSVKQYIRRRRMTLAAHDLIHSKKRILDMAFEFGFESQESFSRAFKDYHQMNPGTFRNRQPLYLSQNKLIVSSIAIDHLCEGVNMEPKFIKKDSFKCVGITQRIISILTPGETGLKPNQDIPNLWGSFFKEVSSVKHREQTDTGLGICIPLEDDSRDRDDEFKYMAATMVSEFGELPEKWESIEIPANEYVVFTHKGPVTNIETTINYIYGSWLPGSNHTRAEGFDFEWYDQRFTDDENSELDYYLPISPK